jgi:hypothetical protein
VTSAMPTNNPMANAAQGQTDPLSQLRPLHLPDAISWWPPAPGWWIVAALTLIAVTLLIRFFIKRHRAKAYRRAALIEAEQLFINHASDPLAYCQQINRLLKRICLQAWPRSESASLYGSAWMTFLNSQCKQTIFNQTSCELLAHSTYQTAKPIDAQQITALNDEVKRWINSHSAQSHKKASHADNHMTRPTQVTS